MGEFAALFRVKDSEIACLSWLVMKTEIVEFLFQIILYTGAAVR